ncbi:type II toxin-antitoxin system RelE/ParE family toxin [Tepidiforma flava]|uniref:Type II toxin-antitoxin system RelE/ParE family toxin n=1 Tax=Tepidiforma flava TaxID=3004094 RepID=A0ABY7MBE4_9CHLR|nr:type II toxin-antitoxin system RelE/ParE family toxin [Tepidiforma flava]WBL37309.1 type II toxin-antitoxin system RelE/ParE family toxin [Tepidiforma flava]
MDVEFRTEELRRRYLEPGEAERAWGRPVARKYIQRVDILRAAGSLAELAALASLRLHPLRGARAGQYALSLNDRWRLIVTVDAAGIVRVEEVTNHYGD